MTYPIPAEAFDDRLAFVGTSGSGKTYAALGALARLLKMSGSRAVMVDALGAMWGLRAQEDGKTASGFDIVIFGGPHGDLPITEHSGALIGETVATMRESVILDLSELGTDAAERRFMLAFLTKLYRNVRKDLTHLVFDEADMWAPQLILDREGEAMKLLGMMKTIVRRGRLRGFVPWLITQRPAELSKGVLSMMDGIVAMGMTGEQDRDAVGGWIKGQADKKAGQAILDSLPGKQIGEGVVWIPRRKILLPEARFPANKTFDSSRAPKRGEKRQKVDLPPLDLTKLQAKMATVLEEAKANDPGELKRQLLAANTELAKLRKLPISTSKPVEKNNMVDQRAQERVLAAARDEGAAVARQAIPALLDAQHAVSFEAGFQFLAARKPVWEPELVPPRKPVPAIEKEIRSTGFPKAAAQVNQAPAPAPRTAAAQTTARPAPTPRPAVQVASGGADGLNGVQRQVLEGLAWWAAMGHEEVKRSQLAGKIGWKAKGSHLKNRLSELSKMGFLTYPSQGTVSLTPEGHAAAPTPNTEETVRGSILASLNGVQTIVFNQLTHEPQSRADIAAAIGWEANGSHLKNRISELSSRELVTYPSKGTVALQDWVQ